MARIFLTLSPGARRDELVGRHGEGWKVSVRAAPERGRANDGVVALLASLLLVPPEAVRIVAGRSSRRKIVEVEGLEDADARRRLEAAARR